MNSILFNKVSFLSLILVLVIIGLGLLFILDKNLFQHQLIALIISLIIFLLITKINFNFWLNLAPILYLINLLLLILVFFFKPIQGSHRWLDIFSFHLQPSELYKVTMVLMAWWLIRNKHLYYKYKKTAFIFGLNFIYLLPIGLIFLEPDLGTAVFLGLTFFIAWLPLLFRPRPFFFLFFLFLTLTPFLWYQLRPYQRQRLTSFLNPLKDPKKSGYNIIQAQLTIANGGLIGQANSNHKYEESLPAAKTDFIFASWIENTGFLGGLIIIIIYLFISHYLYLLKDSLTSDELIPLSMFLFFIPVQAFIHMAINLQLLPITGITLPFVSYGRSALISNFVLLGFLFSRLQQKGFLVNSTNDQSQPTEPVSKIIKSLKT